LASDAPSLSTDNLDNLGILMATLHSYPAPTDPALTDSDEPISLLGLGAVLLRWRRTIVVLGLLGFATGATLGLTRPRMYVSSATFLPQGAESPSSGLAAAASQLGIRVPTTGGGWGPAVYVELLRSRTLLEPIARDTIAVAELQGRRVPVMDLLEIKRSAGAERTDRAVRRLRGMVRATELRPIGAVEVRVATEWPSVSLTLAERLVSAVNQFNLETRKSQAAAERHFVERRAAEIERSLREAEDRLQTFLQRNRIINPNSEQAFERERLQREVTRRTQLYTSLLEGLEEARIREVRDTPVITLLATPHAAVLPEPRGTVTKAVLGALAGTAIGILIAFVAHGTSRARQQATDEAREFFELVHEATPRFLRGRRR
jgi:uncharacterized protein involved in exopolysaccharide biosynthesis